MPNYGDAQRDAFFEYEYRCTEYEYDYPYAESQRVEPCGWVAWQVGARD